MIKSVLVLATLLAYLLAPAGLAAGVPANARLLVRVQPTLDLAERTRLYDSIDGTVTAQIPQLNLIVLSVPSTRLNAAATALSGDNAVIYAEPDVQGWALDAPNDPGWTEQWGLQIINTPLAWQATAGSPEVIIAALDSGVTMNHPDLANQLWVNPGEFPANGVDDDGNGKIDDAWGWHFYIGWAGQTPVTMEDGHVADDYGHGTHVAGIAAAETNNGIGVAGVAGGSRLMTVKVIDAYGLTWYSLVAQGIVYAVDNGARIINLSLGGPTPSQALQDAVDYAWAHGAIIVAAAGNNDDAVFYPAACDHALAVAATGANDYRPSWSNAGPQVDVAAPGVDIYSTWPWQDNYWTESGTSMAAPHVSGLAALIKSLEPGWTPAQVTEIITGTAHDVDIAGWDPYTGWGRIDAGAALSHLVQTRTTLAQEITPLEQRPGGLVTYTISLSNDGDMIGKVVLSDTLPAGVVLQSASPPAGYDPANHELVWGPFTLVAGAQVTMSAVVSVAPDLAGCPRLTNSVYGFYDGLKLPARIDSSHYVRPCYIYLPLILNGPYTGIGGNPLAYPSQ